MRRALYCLFTTYGSVLDINILKTMKMRGQAHIVFRDIPAAALAMRQCDNIEFMGRTIVSAASRRRSDIISRSFKQAVLTLVPEHPVCQKQEQFHCQD